jgi:hypothetical protein
VLRRYMRGESTFGASPFVAIRIALRREHHGRAAVSNSEAPSTSAFVPSKRVLPAAQGHSPSSCVRARLLRSSTVRWRGEAEWGPRAPDVRRTGGLDGAIEDAFSSSAV